MATPIVLRNPTVTADSIESLLAEAESFGSVTIGNYHPAYTPPNCYSCKITFETLPGTSLEAKSDGFRHTFADALRSAITNARKIRAQFK